MVPLTQTDMAILVDALDVFLDIPPKADPTPDLINLHAMLKALEGLKHPRNTFKAQALLNDDPAKARQTLARRGKDPNV